MLFALQVPPPVQPAPAATLSQQMQQAQLEGIPVRAGDIGGFRGARGNVVTGYGLVVGLDGTGDSRNTPFTAKLLANALSRWGTLADPDQMRGKNIAAVSITCTLPAFAAPGRQVDISVQSIGDAKSLQGGFLIPAPLGPGGNIKDVYVMASGPVSIGGFNASGGGSTVRRNHQNAGRVPNGGSVEKTVRTQFVFEGGKVYFDLDQPDFTTAQRLAAAIIEALPTYRAQAIDGATIAITLPPGVDHVFAVSQIESLDVLATVPAKVVLNERTGTIVIGGNVKLGPAVIAHGSLQVRIDPIVDISQPAPFSEGETTTVISGNTEAGEEPTQIGLLSGSATLNDLAKILQTLKVSARDIIAILQALAAQGSLKARIEIQ